MRIIQAALTMFFCVFLFTLFILMGTSMIGVSGGSLLSLLLVSAKIANVAAFFGTVCYFWKTYVSKL